MHVMAAPRAPAVANRPPLRLVWHRSRMGLDLGSSLGLGLDLTGRAAPVGSSDSVGLLLYGSSVKAVRI